MSDPTPRPCQADKCRKDAIKGERFCHACRSWQLHLMAKSGYLPKLGEPSFPARGGTAKEHKKETKGGMDL